MRILVFGDSIAQGFWDTQGGWANRLHGVYAQDYFSGQDADPPVVFNLGISGETTMGLLERFQSEVRARKYPGEELVFVIASGTNDTMYRGDKHDFEPEHYNMTLNRIYQQARDEGGNILFVSLFPVVDELLQPLPGSSTGKCFSTERMELFNDVLKNFCAKNNLPLVDLWTPFAAVPDLNALLDDGLHPSDAGHQLITSLVKPELDKLIN